MCRSNCRTSTLNLHEQRNALAHAAPYKIGKDVQEKNSAPAWQVANLSTAVSYLIPSILKHMTRYEYAHRGEVHGRTMANISAAWQAGKGMPHAERRLTSGGPNQPLNCEHIPRTASFFGVYGPKNPFRAHSVCLGCGEREGVVEALVAVLGLGLFSLTQPQRPK